jgi:integrase
MSSRPLSEDEYAAIVSRLAADGRRRDRLLVVLGCATGFRITELLSLTVGQVWNGHDVAREVTVARRHLKGGRSAHCRAVHARRVPLAEPARAAIRDFLATLGPNPPPERHLFTTSRSGERPLHRAQAHRILIGIVEGCGFDATRISTHTLRKTFVARIWRASGHDLIKTQRIVGHTSPLTTARYLETDQDDLDQLVRSLAA